MFEQPIAVIDFETTGIDTKSCRAIEVAVVMIEGNRITDRFSSLIRSVRHIPPEITRITGIDQKMVSAAPPPNEVMNSVYNLMSGANMAAHNASFDLAVLKRELSLSSLPEHGDEFREPPICTLRLARRLTKNLSRMRLVDVMGFYGVSFSGQSHRAESDAVATAEILLAMARDITSRYRVDSISPRQLKRIMRMRIQAVDESMRSLFLNASASAPSQRSTQSRGSAIKGKRNTTEVPPDEGVDWPALLQRIALQEKKISELAKQIELLSAENKKLKTERAEEGVRSDTKRVEPQKDGATTNEPTNDRSSEGELVCKNCDEVIPGNPIELPISLKCPCCGFLIMNYLS